MLKGPVCGKCRVAEAIEEIVKEYQSYISLMGATQCLNLTNHARGYRAGTIYFALDAIDDLNAIIPYLQQEAGLRAKSDK